jgi:hypothetical protein
MPSIANRLNINITKKQILKSIEQVKGKEESYYYHSCDRCYIGKLLDIVSKEPTIHLISCIDIKECLNHQYGTNYDTILCSPTYYRGEYILAKLQHYNRTINI